MSKPQLEDGYIRIANELWNEVLRRDFSKRQQNLILFIWRLSYGTGQKDCLIEQFNFFELTGIYRSDIKKELNYLRDSAVLDWDEETMIFSINKDYKYWQISPRKNWNTDRFDELIHTNLSRKKVSKTLTSSIGKVSKTLTMEDTRVSESLTNEVDEVSKTLTGELVNYQLSHVENPVGARAEDMAKDSIKDIKRFKDNKAATTDSKEMENLYTAHRRIFGYELNPFQAESLGKYIDEDGMEESLVIRALEKMGLESTGYNLRFATAILDRYLKSGVKTLDEAVALDNSFQANKQGRSNAIRGKPLPTLATSEEAEISDEEYEQMLATARRLEEKI